MKHTFVKVLHLLIYLDFGFGQWTLEGDTKSFTFLTTKQTSSPTINWFIKKENQNESLFLCETSSFLQCSPRFDEYLQLYSANVTSSSTSYISVFTITNVNISQHNSRWFVIAIYNNPPLSTEPPIFDLKVFAIPEISTCDNAILLNDSYIQIKCASKKVFPGALCQFFANINVSNENELTKGSLSYQTFQNWENSYHNTTCTYVVPATTLGPGTHMFRVKMYPNITGEVTDEMKKTSNYTRSIYIAYPRAHLGEDCQIHGYIQENKISSCTCYDNNTGIIPSAAHWNKNELTSVLNGTILFTAKRNNWFQCTVSNAIDWNETTVFQPNISYPPNTISVYTTNQVFDFCNDTDIVVYGSCLIDKGNPEPLISINMNNAIHIDSLTLHKNREYKFNTTISNFGVYYISCQAHNPEYSINRTSTSIIVTVRGYPSTPILFKNGNKVNVTESNDIIEITEGDKIGCEAKGGFPKFRILTLTCGPEKINITNEDHLNMTIHLSNITHGKCECVVWHESKCQQKLSTEVLFNYTLSKKSISTGHNFENIYIGVGVTAICILLGMVAIVILTPCRHHNLDKNSSGTAEKNVNNKDLYFIKREKSSINISIYPEYRNVATTMASASEVPKNLKK